LIDYASAQLRPGIGFVLRPADVYCAKA